MVLPVLSGSLSYASPPLQVTPGVRILGRAHFGEYKARESQTGQSESSEDSPAVWYQLHSTAPYIPPPPPPPPVFASQDLNTLSPMVQKKIGVSPGSGKMGFQHSFIEHMHPIPTGIAALNFIGLYLTHLWKLTSRPGDEHNL